MCSRYGNFKECQYPCFHQGPGHYDIKTFIAWLNGCLKVRGSSKLLVNCVSIFNLVKISRISFQSDFSKQKLFSNVFPIEENIIKCRK